MYRVRTVHGARTALPGLPASASNPAYTTFGFGNDCDHTTLSAIAEAGRGSFTFISQSDTLDEALAAFAGDSTRVLSPEYKATFEFADGVTLIKMKGPGANAAPDAAHNTNREIFYLSAIPSWAMSL